MENNIIGLVAILSLIATLISVMLVWFQLRNNRKVAISSNHLKLRELFSTENNLLVNENLMPNGNWMETDFSNLNLKETVKLNDYLGLFEVCEAMLSNGTLDINLFKSSFLYKIQNIANLNLMHDKIYGYEQGLWSDFEKLLERLSITLK